MQRSFVIATAALAALSLAACSKPVGTKTSDTSTQTPNAGPGRRRRFHGRQGARRHLGSRWDRIGRHANDGAGVCRGCRE